VNKFIRMAIASFCALQLTALAAPAADYTMRIASGANSAGFACKEFLTGWAEKVKKDSGGRIDYQLFCDGTLGRMGDTVNRVQNGVADVGWDVPLAYGSRFAPFGVIGLPGLYARPVDAGGAFWKLYENGEIPPAQGVKLVLIQAFNNIGLWTVKPLGDATKLDRLKFAMGSKERAIILQKMGGVPLNLRVPEYYQALAKGAADGLLSNDSSVFDFSITELLKHTYRGKLGGGIVGVFMNEKWYNALPPELKQVIDANSGYAASKWASSLLATSEQALLQNAVTKQGITVHQLSPEELVAWQPAFDAAIASWTSETPNGAAYLEAFRKRLQEEMASNQ
jgi:TRAP-type transport system periplasmic protein